MDLFIRYAGRLPDYKAIEVKAANTKNTKSNILTPKDTRIFKIILEILEESHLNHLLCCSALTNAKY